MAGTRNQPSLSEIRKRRPAATSPLFTIWIVPDGALVPIRVIVPVRIAAKATERNRIRRQVAEVFRRALTGIKHPQVVVVVRHARIPVGDALASMVCGLLQESGMIERQ